MKCNPAVEDSCRIPAEFLQKSAVFILFFTQLVYNSIQAAFIYDDAGIRKYIEADLCFVLSSVVINMILCQEDL